MSQKVQRHRVSLLDHHGRMLTSNSANHLMADRIADVRWTGANNASEEVTFKNGVTGIWAVQQYHAGPLKLSNGQTLYLYCPRCQAKAFPTVNE